MKNYNTIFKGSFDLNKFIDDVLQNRISDEEIEEILSSGKAEKFLYTPVNRFRHKDIVWCGLYVKKLKRRALSHYEFDLEFCLYMKRVSSKVKKMGIFKSFLRHFRLIRLEKFKISQEESL